MIHNKFLLILLFIFLFPLLSNGQKQANHWYFGNKAGLNFNGTLSAIGNGQLNTQEGCSGYSDPHTGQLLFIVPVILYGIKTMFRCRMGLVWEVIIQVHNLHWLFQDREVLLNFTFYRWFVGRHATNFKSRKF